MVTMRMSRLPAAPHRVLCKSPCVYRRALLQPGNQRRAGLSCRRTWARSVRPCLVPPSLRRQKVQARRHHRGRLRPQSKAADSADLLTYRMLRCLYSCRPYKKCFSHWLESGILNLDDWQKKVHTTAGRCNEYKTQEQAVQTEAQELHTSPNRDSDPVAQLHIPVMVDEVIRCLAPQKGQGCG
ncbi:12S rRNA N4-methylcytidine (m4C) methyltransferase isoform X4 [Cavia porcellus]|uniref:12S rRNA N4-methylcytidine (m4C) methyltransferase isoform X4 n=1 Tax=Cavia porcellus TaxID=10141 RepID=UPI002FE0440C